MKFIDPFLESLFSLAGDTDHEVQKQLCKSLTLLLDSYLDKLAPHLNNIVEFMIMRTQVIFFTFFNSRQLIIFGFRIPMRARR